MAEGLQILGVRAEGKLEIRGWDKGMTLTYQRIWYHELWFESENHEKKRRVYSLRSQWPSQAQSSRLVDGRQVQLNVEHSSQYQNRDVPQKTIAAHEIMRLYTKQ